MSRIVHLFATGWVVKRAVQVRSLRQKAAVDDPAKD